MTLLAVCLASLGCGESRVGVGPIAMRRITPDQYRESIADVFGPDIKIVGRFEPDSRRPKCRYANYKSDDQQCRSSGAGRSLSR